MTPVACRWRRRWQWGAGSSRTHDAAELASAPVDIEQPATADQYREPSSSTSQNVLERATSGAAESSSTPVNFPGMHYSRFAASAAASDVSILMPFLCL